MNNYNVYKITDKKCCEYDNKSSGINIYIALYL